MQVYLKADVKRGAATNFAGENLATVASLLATPHRAPAYQPGSSAGNGGCIVLLVNVEVCSEFFCDMEEELHIQRVRVQSK